MTVGLESLSPDSQIVLRQEGRYSASVSQVSGLDVGHSQGYFPLIFEESFWSPAQPPVSCEFSKQNDTCKSSRTHSGQVTRSTEEMLEEVKSISSHSQIVLQQDSRFAGTVS